MAGKELYRRQALSALLLNMGKRYVQSHRRPKGYGSSPRLVQSHHQVRRHRMKRVESRNMQRGYLRWF